MSIPTLLGFIVGLILFLSSIIFSTDNYSVFFHLTGFVMVVGGTIASTFISYEPRYIFQSLRVLLTLFNKPKIGRNILPGEIGRMIRWSYLIQKNGIPILESEILKLKNQDFFLSFGLNLLLHGYSSQDVREILHNNIETSFQRKTIPADILKSMANNAPAFGMIATLIGLVIMLDTMGNDASKIGTGMAVGLLGTLYGIGLARFIFLPASNKIQQREEINRYREYLVAEGFALLADRRKPLYIQDKMNSYLDSVLHFKIENMIQEKIFE
jgi:chemotaxis protein MotA